MAYIGASIWEALYGKPYMGSPIWEALYGSPHMGFTKRFLFQRDFLYKWIGKEAGE